MGNDRLCFLLFDSFCKTREGATNLYAYGDLLKVAITHLGIQIYHSLGFDIFLTDV